MTITSKTSNRVGIRTCFDYSPFGVELDGRTVSGGYRIGYNGHEKDDEISGYGNHLSWSNFGMDPRLGRRWDSDPHANKLPDQSPYSVNNNSPISVFDPDGEFGILGAAIGAVGGFIYGSFTYGFSDGNWKKTLAATSAGAIGGATIGLGTAAIASFAAAGTTGATAILSGTTYLGGANTTMISGCTSILSLVTAELVNQASLNVLGVQHGLDKDSFIATLSVAIPSALTGGLLDKLGGRVLNELTMHQAKKLGIETALTAQKEFVNENKKLIKQLGKDTGVRITNKTAKKTALKMWDKAVESNRLKTNMVVKVSEKAISITTAAAGEVVSDKIKNGAKN
jgi:hypothetical protein